MIYEYALNPALLNNWRDFRYFIEKFGVARGRLISRYPSRWKRAVYDAIDTCLPTEKKNIEIYLLSIDERIFLPRINEWNNQLDWHNNAIAEDSKRPFHAIISAANPTNHPKVLKSDTLTETDPLMKTATSLPIKRTEIDMCKPLRLLLMYSRQIIFIDPHFWPNNTRHIRPLRAWLQAIASRPANVPLTRLEYRTSDKGDEEEFKREADRTLKRSIPAGLTLSLIRLKKETMHNRYVLTDLGAVMFSTGLDDSDGSALQDDTITLLDAFAYDAIWREHLVSNVCHTVSG